MTTSVLLSNGTSITAATTILAVGDLVAVYGTLRDGHGNHRNTQMPDKTDFVGVGTVPGFMRSVGGFPAYLPADNGDSITVEVYSVVDASVGPRLDGLEGYRRADPENSMYVRTLTDVTLWDDRVLEGVNIYAWNGDYERLAPVESGDWNKFTSRGAIIAA